MNMMIAEFQSSLNCFDPVEVDNCAEIARYAFHVCPITKANKIGYFECPASFDIETSSFYSGKEKAATMYIWSFGLMGRVIIGRTWEEFVKCVETISLEMRLSSEQRLVVYVHNMDFDFQFFRKWLSWDKVFSIEERKPVYAVSTLGIEFRCSYKLSGYSLETVGKNLRRFPVKKLTGDLDYSVARHSRTPLSKHELAYVINDAKVVMAYIAECILEEGSITRIPLTKTGYVRRFVRERCFRRLQRNQRRISSLYQTITTNG